MHRYFPFDSVVINGTEIGRDQIVAAAMRFVSGGNDTVVTTADGRTHFIRQSVRREAVLEVFGDRQDLIRLKAIPVTLMRNSEVFLTFSSALVSAQFHEEQGATAIRILEVSFP